MTWVPQNFRVDVPFTVNRTDRGPLTIHATSLPDGVTANDVTLANDESSGAITLSASSTATLGATSAGTFELLEGAQRDDQATLTVGVSGAPGTPDTTWGNGGVVTLPPLVDCPTANYVVDMDSQGRILAGGTCVVSDTVVDLLITRYLPDTGLDTTFAQHIGYERKSPGPSNGASLTYPVGLRVDAQDRIVLANARNDPNQNAIAEVRRWTVDGILESSATFHPYSDQVNGTGYSGAPTGLVLEPDGQIVLLAWWNYDGGMETLLQTLATDGSPEGTYHIVLEPGTLASQHFTQMWDVAMDDRGGFVLGGRQFDGAKWIASGPMNGAIARVGADGLRDMSFGTNAYASYDQSFASIFWHVAVDPSTKDIFGVGEDANSAHGSIVRLDGTTGQPSGFGQMAVDACPGGTGQAFTQVMVDSRSRIVATGPCGKNGVSNIGLARVSLDGVVDTQFGSVGNAPTPGSARGAKLAADDRLYVVGEIDSTAAIWRFWP